MFVPGKDPTMPEVVLRQRRCRACTAVFCICRHCDRGQCYCSPACRQGARRQQRRAANRRHQRTEGGRRAHRIRQRHYRLRQAGVRVTDHGSRSIIKSRPADRGGFGHCAICGRYSRWIDPFAAILLRRSVHKQQQAAGKSSKNTFSDDRQHK
jgi:hypothetical protein